MYNAPMPEGPAAHVIWKTIGLKRPEKALWPLAPYAEYLLLERGYSPRGVRRYLQDLAFWFRFLEAEGLSPSPEAVRALLLRERWAPRRVQGFLAALRSYYRYLREVKGEAASDPTEGIGRPKAGRRLPLHPGPEELKRFLEAFREEKEAALLEALARFLYGTGLRISEALSLKGRNVVLEEEAPWRCGWWARGTRKGSCRSPRRPGRSWRPWDGRREM